MTTKQASPPGITGINTNPTLLEIEKCVSELDHQLMCMHILTIEREAKITEDVKRKLAWVWNHIEVIKQDVSAAVMTPCVKKLEMEVGIIVTQL